MRRLKQVSDSNTNQSTIRPVHVRGLADKGFGGFHEGFAERRMWVDAVGEVAGDGGGFGCSPDAYVRTRESSSC